MHPAMITACVQLKSDRCIFNSISWIAIYEPHILSLAPLLLAFSAKTRDHNGRKEATSPSGSTGISIHARPLGLRPYSETRKEAARIAGERVRAREGRGEKGVHICMPSHSLTAVRTDNSRVLFLRSSTGGIGIQRGKWKRISLLPPPYQWWRARDEFLVHFYFFLSPTCFPTTLSFQPSPHCFLFPIGASRPLLPNSALFPLTPPTSESLSRLFKLSRLQTLD